jgi:hypothetical protein
MLGVLQSLHDPGTSNCFDVGSVVLSLHAASATASAINIRWVLRRAVIIVS